MSIKYFGNVWCEFFFSDEKLQWSRGTVLKKKKNFANYV